ncbi:MAG TPA: poly-gamma-glutamate biosynthesis protein PgsC [Armatimonadota bacterium]
MATVAIALGLGFGFGFEQLTGLVAGGLVVPGYLALYAWQPWRLVGTTLVALLAYGCTRLMEKRVVLYGRRRATLTILLGFVFTWALAVATARMVPAQPDALAAVGYLVPGLLASTMVRQGPLATLLGAGVVAVVTRLALLVIAGVGGL